MKQIFKILTVAFLAVAFWSCSGDKEVPLTVSTSSVNFSSTGGTQRLAVSSSADWNATSSASWCKASRELDELVITVEKQWAAKARKAEVMVTTASETQVVTVNQAAGSGKLAGAITLSSVAFPDLDPQTRDEIVVSSVAKEYIFQVKVSDPKYEWRAEVVEGDFVTSSVTTNVKATGYVTFTTTSNTTVEQRQAKVKIICEYQGASDTYDLTIKQESSHRNEDPGMNDIIEW